MFFAGVPFLHKSEIRDNIRYVHQHRIPQSPMCFYQDLTFRFPIFTRTLCYVALLCLLSVWPDVFREHARQDRNFAQIVQNLGFFVKTMPNFPLLHWPRFLRALFCTKILLFSNFQDMYSFLRQLGVKKCMFSTVVKTAIFLCKNCFGSPWR